MYSHIWWAGSPFSSRFLGGNATQNVHRYGSRSCGHWHPATVDVYPERAVAEWPPALHLDRHGMELLRERFSDSDNMSIANIIPAP